jgi:hypothetical protein
MLKTYPLASRQPVGDVPLAVSRKAILAAAILSKPRLCRSRYVQRHLAFATRAHRARHLFCTRGSIDRNPEGIHR